MSSHIALALVILSWSSGCSQEAQSVSSCTLDATWHYAQIGGLAPMRRQSRLSPPAQYAFEVQRSAPSTIAVDGGVPDQSCTATLPACIDPADEVTVADINQAFADRDVLAAFTVSALSSPVLFGVDQRPVDGTVLEVGRDDDGRGFLVGAACDTQPGCTPMPAGIARLADLLTRLDEQQLGRAPCLPVD